MGNSPQGYNGGLTSLRQIITTEQIPLECQGITGNDLVIDKELMVDLLNNIHIPRENKSMMCS